MPPEARGFKVPRDIIRLFRVFYRLKIYFEFYFHFLLMEINMLIS